MNTIRATLSIAGLLLVLLAASCGRPVAGAARKTAPAGDAPADSSAVPAAKDEQAEPSDLDRPVEELFAVTCEHEKKTFECDECRYEIGVVRVPAKPLRGRAGQDARRPSAQRVAIPLALTGEVRFDERRVTHVSSQAEGIVREGPRRARRPGRARGSRWSRSRAWRSARPRAPTSRRRRCCELARRNSSGSAELREENISSEKEYLAGPAGARGGRDPRASGAAAS